MNALRKNTQILDQQHEMYAEGQCDNKPSREEIKELLLKEGFLMYDLDVFYDNMLAVWIWNCKIAKE